MKNWEHEMDTIEELIKSYNKSYAEYLIEKYSAYKYICVFGVGNIGISTANALKQIGLQIDFFCDNSKDKVDKYFMEIPCRAPEYLLERKEDTCVIISTRYYKEILAQLKNMRVLHTDRVFVNKFGLREKLSLMERSNIIKLIRDTLVSLADDKSREIYVTVLKNWLSLSYSQQEIDAIYSDDQYFPLDVFKLGNNEVFVDGGAYNGDTFQMFLNSVGGEFKKALLFELCESNYKDLKANILKYPYKIVDRAVCINKGLSNSEKQIRYIDADEGSAIHGEGDKIGTLVSLDTICADYPITYIKLDVEGSEKEALQGAETIIKSYNPKLAVCLYHRLEDLWELPLYIKQIQPAYQLYIRHHTDLLNETVCYAIKVENER